MARADHEHGKVVPVTECTDRDNRCVRKPPFIQTKNDGGDNAEYYKTNNGGNSPGVLRAAEFEAQEEHQCSTNNQNESNPVDCVETFKDTF